MCQANWETHGPPKPLVAGSASTAGRSGLYEVAAAGVSTGVAGSTSNILRWPRTPPPQPCLSRICGITSPGSTGQRAARVPEAISGLVSTFEETSSSALAHEAAHQAAAPRIAGVG
jgi:hypothetical protein